MNKKITIVIVTYNSRQHLPDCLGSLERQNYDKSLIKIVVVDNHSTDSSVGYIKETFPSVKIVENRTNFGFAKANNQGYYLANKNKSDYLVLLNDDVIVEKNWLSKLVDLSESDKSIAAVQPKILLNQNRDRINSLGNSTHYLGFAYCNHYNEEDKKGKMAPFQLPYASGAAVLLRMSALEKTGLFDDSFFMYHEDVDLGWRLNLAGYKVMLEPASVIYHKYSYSKAKYKFYHMDRNRLIVILQNYRVLTLLLFLPMFLVMELGIILFSIKNGWFKEKIKGWGWILTHLPHILSQRLNVQFKIRQVKDRKIIRLFVSTIRFQEIDNPLLKYIVNPLMKIYWFVVKWIVIW
jgi:GT2 family glycosyltransferase